jgi:peptide/nickel transport system substrate-binding protein
VNIAGFCDKAIDQKMFDAQATAIADPVKGAQMWTDIDKAVTDAAPVAVLFTPKRIDLVSKRLKNFTFSPQFYWIVSQSWVE